MKRVINKSSRNIISCTQSVPSKAFMEAIERKRKKNAAFESWRKKLSRKDKLPRGKFFKGKNGGKDEGIAVDEFFLPIYSIGIY